MNKENFKKTHNFEVENREVMLHPFMLGSEKNRYEYNNENF